MHTALLRQDAKRFALVGDILSHILVSALSDKPVHVVQRLAIDSETTNAEALVKLGARQLGVERERARRRRDIFERPTSVSAM